MPCLRNKAWRKERKMRLIDADALIDKFKSDARKSKNDISFAQALMYAVTCIDYEADWQPTIEQPRWISCAERLPELHTKVLCCGKKGGRFIAELNTWGHDNALYWTKRDGKGCPTVTHWMPLPMPPTEDE